MESRSCNFAFTHNNPDESGNPEETIKCRYIIYGKETGASGTPHHQGTVCFKSQTALRVAIKKLPGCHVEICKDLQSSIDYCKKDGDYVERGEAPMTQKEKGAACKRYYEEIIEVAKLPRSEWEAKLTAEQFVKHDKFLERHHDRHSKQRKIETNPELKNEWIYGPSGTGKSREVREKYPNAYLKMANKWWDGYQDEPVIILEDLDPGHEKLCHHLKLWADHYPFLAEYKGGATKIRPEKILVTSNYHPEEIWKEENDLAPIMRRFKVINKKKSIFDPQKIPPKNAACFNA